MGTLTDKKSEYGRKITHFLKVGVKKQNKKKVGEKWTRAHFLKVGIPPKKKVGMLTFFLKKNLAHLPQ